MLALHAGLSGALPDGVLDVVPAGRTILVVTDPDVTPLADVTAAVRAATPRPGARGGGDLLEVPVVYDGEDLDDVAGLLGCDRAEVVRRHTGQEWTVAFCGFAPGFGYLVSRDGGWDVPRRSSPRTKVPAGAVALAGEFSGVYPRASPGGWRLLGRTELAVFDLDREPAALLTPGRPVRFVDVTGEGS
ncbi:allophanate hydrolase [Angustibacter aerolatus]|uniref:Allophanate hydrolase n=1 Tax=Angustibacter aerolatus TaxID=1162965 RepID=A0ABQ6JG30_9ACTN|nr:allophanate hydrolase subunit 1 [Angustibacter aerolatus]GMA87150.1 allophanate hydrolase [Angustibacter aerolatus]